MENGKDVAVAGKAGQNCVETKVVDDAEEVKDFVPSVGVTSEGASLI